MKTLIVASFALPMLSNVTFEMMMTVMTMMIRMRPVMKTLIVASFALPMLSNVTFEVHIRTRKR